MQLTSSSDAANKKEQDTLALLEADHRGVEKIFDQFEKTCCL